MPSCPHKRLYSAAFFAARSGILLKYGVQHRPEVLAADSNVEARTTAVQLARALRFPNVTLGAGYQQQELHHRWQWIVRDGSIQHAITRAATGVSKLTLALPLFNRNQGNVTSADYERRAAEETARYVRNVVENEISIAIDNYRSRVLTRTLYEESVLPQLQRNVDAIQESYRLGNENIFAVIQVQRTFFDTRHEYIQTLLDLELDRIDLERATGGPSR